MKIQDRSDELGVVTAEFSATNDANFVPPSLASTPLCASEGVKDALVSCYQDPRHPTLGLRGIVSLNCCRLLHNDDELQAAYEAARYMQVSLIGLGWEEGSIVSFLLDQIGPVSTWTPPTSSLITCLLVCIGRCRVGRPNTS